MGMKCKCAISPQQQAALSDPALPDDEQLKRGQDGVDLHLQVN